MTTTRKLGLSLKVDRDGGWGATWKVDGTTGRGAGTVPSVEAGLFETLHVYLDLALSHGLAVTFGPARPPRAFWLCCDDPALPVVVKHIDNFRQIFAIESESLAILACLLHEYLIRRCREGGP